jgi:hypothetical protein
MGYISGIKASTTQPKNKSKFLTSEDYFFINLSYQRVAQGLSFSTIKVT